MISKVSGRSCFGRKIMDSFVSRSEDRCHKIFGTLMGKWGAILIQQFLFSN